MKNIKLFKNYVKEYLHINNTYLKWQKLDSEIRTDIVENVYYNSTFLQKEYKIWHFKDLLDNSYELPQFEIIYKNVEDLWRDNKDMCSISNINLSKLVHDLERDGELTPILFNGKNFYDGCHRLAAYIEMEISEIATIDISSMLNMDWEKWLDGKINF